MADNQKALSRIFFAGIVLFLIAVIVIAATRYTYGNRDAAIAAYILITLLFVGIAVFSFIWLVKYCKSKREGRTYELLTASQAITIIAAELTWFLVRFFVSGLIG